jgi:hypothetical protein
MTQSIKVILRNPLDKTDLVDYTIVANDTLLAHDWISALRGLLESGNLIEKNFCFMGFPKTARTIEYLCGELNQAVTTINSSSIEYHIPEVFTSDNVIGYDWGKNGVNHELFNKLHNHFERLQGTVWGLSDYYRQADYVTKYAIRQLNNLCHEMETLILSRRKLATDPYWVRPSQITTFLQAPRYDLKPEHRQGFIHNGYNRVMGGVYMHWTQIGKTLFEVFRDEGAPKLTATVCEAITELQYYSGEFDIEWGNDIVLHGPHDWHNQQQEEFCRWLMTNDRDPTDVNLSLGYLSLGQVDLAGSFGTTDYQTIWDILGSHSDIHSIQVEGVTRTYDYCWTDPNYKQQQIDMMKPGYDYSSRG